MSKIDVDQIRIVRSIAQQLAVLPLDDVNLLLYNANGVRELTTDEWYGDWSGRYEVTDDDKRRMLTNAIRHLDKSDLIALAGAMNELFNTEQLPSEGEKREPAPLQLFASHLTTQREFVHQVANSLRRWDVQLFVAHDDITPDESWHDTIEESLKTVNGGVVFMYPNFNSSQWCDQEVGWLLGRGVPVRTLIFNNQAPYGPLGKRQGVKVHDSSTAEAVADSLITWVAGRLELRPQFNSSLVQALANSTSFAQTDRIWSKLAVAEDLTAGQVATATTAVRDNNQVFGASCRAEGEDYGKWYPEVIIPFLVRQPGYDANADLVAGAAEARNLSRLLPGQESERIGQ